MPSQSPDHEMTPVVTNIQKQPQPRPLGISEHPFARRHIFALAGEWDSSQGGSIVASTIHGQNCTPSSSQNNSGAADITQRMNSTQSTTQWWSIYTPTATPGTSSRYPPASGGISQTDSTHHVVFSPASSIASTPTALSSLENLPTTISNPEARVIITDWLQTGATEMSHRQRQWQLQLQEVSAPRSVVSRCRSIHWFFHSDMIYLEFAMGRPMELYMWNRWLFISASDSEMVSYATWGFAKAFSEAPYLQIIEMYWNTAMQQNNIWSIAFQAWTQKILKDVCCSNGPHWILHTQTSTRFEHKSTKLNPILFHQQGTT